MGLTALLLLKASNVTEVEPSMQAIPKLMFWSFFPLMWITVAEHWWQRRHTRR